MKFKTVFFIATLVLTCFKSNAQVEEEDVVNFIKGATEKELLEMNSQFMMEGLLYYSDLVIDKLLILKPESCNYNYRKGFSTLEVYKNYTKAIPYFIKSLESINNNYDIFSVNEKSAPSDAYFYLGICYHLNEEIDKAEENFNKFKSLSRKNSELLPKVELYLAQCAEARIQMADPVKVFLNNIGPKVNSQFPDYSTVISLDGSALYFTSRRPWSNRATEKYKDKLYNQYPEDVYVSYQDFDGNWLEPTRLKFCEAQRNEATVAVGTDERKIFLYLDSTGNGDIYYSDFYKAKFNDIAKLEIKGLNTEYWETHAMMSHDKNRLYFVSDRPKGFGGRDIYYCDYLGEDKWSEPKNMGPAINTPFDEDSPFISVDNKTLFFSSNGPKSIGGFDIMKADLQDDGSWSKGKNIGYPFNSTNDDIYYTTTVDGLKGYMTSFRKNGQGEKDIYEIHNEFLGIQNVSVFSGTIKSSDGKELDDNLQMRVKVICEECKEYQKRVVFPRPRDGFFISGLEPCKTYKIEYNNVKDEQAVYYDSFTTACDSTFQKISRELIVNPDGTLFLPKVVEIPVEEIKKVYPNLEFMQYLGFNKNKLTPEEGELHDFLVKIENQLIDGREKIAINIYASASTVPTETFKSNDLLAEKRAENIQTSLREYFNKSPFKDQVTINVVSAIVQGPEYQGDSDNEDKYGPYQYVGLKTK